MDDEWCDMFLLKSSLAYHGPQLLEELQAERQIGLRDLPSVTPNSHSRNQRDEFNQRLVKFIAKKADLLFAKDPVCNFKWSTGVLNAENHYAVLPPIEHFMEVPKMQRRQQLFYGIKRGNLVVGVVTAVQETGLLLNLLTIETGQIKDLDQLKINAFCPVREIPRSHSHENVLETFSIRDKIRAVVLSIQSDRMVVSLQSRNLPTSLDVHLGPVNDEELPLHYRRLVESLSSGGKTYESFLRQVLEFHNPSNVLNLISMFDIRDNSRQPSLMRGLFRVRYREEDYSDRLRKSQSYRLSMQSVGEGVKHFKHGERLEAMQLFNRALQIDVENIEALVARGALYANCESYQRAIEDFEEAIRLNPAHANAKKYLHQTLTAYAYNLMEKETESAAVCVRQAVELDPSNEETLSLLKQIQKRMEPARKVSPLGSESRQQLEENQSVINHAKETLIRMIQEDQYGRGSRQKSRTFSEGNDSKVKKVRRASCESAALSSQEQREDYLHQSLQESKERGHLSERSPRLKQQVNNTGRSLSPESTEFFKAVMITGKPDRNTLLEKESIKVFGPPLPPSLTVESSSRVKRKSYSSSSLCRSNSMSRLSSNCSKTSSNSSLSTSSSSSSSCHSKEEKFRRSTNSKKYVKSKKLKRPRSKDTSFRCKTRSLKVGGSSDLKRDLPHTSEKNSDRWKSLAGSDSHQEIMRKDRCSSERNLRSRKFQVSRSVEKSRKRLKVENIDSYDRNNRKEKDVSNDKRSSESVKKSCYFREYSSKIALINYSSSSSDHNSEHRSTKSKGKLNAKQISQEANSQKSPPGETLQDLEQFLQELKAKKKALGK